MVGIGSKKKTSDEDVEELLGRKISQGAAAKIVGVPVARISQVKHEAMLVQDADGYFILGDFIRNWIKYLNVSKSAARAEDDAAIRKLKIETLQAEAAERKGTMAPRRELLDLVYDREARLAAAYHGLPGRFTRDVKDRQRLLKMISDIEKKFHREIKDDDAA